MSQASNERELVKSFEKSERGLLLLREYSRFLTKMQAKYLPTFLIYSAAPELAPPIIGGAAKGLRTLWGLTGGTESNYPILDGTCISECPVLYNHPLYKEHRKLLRRKASDAERLLWCSLKSRRLFGFRFRRQYGAGRYVLDFFCPQTRLAIEIDGPIHLKQVQIILDKKRDTFLKGLNITVLRFTNDDVVNRYDEVLRKIRDAL